MEAILTWSEVRVLRDPARACLDPLGIKAVQSVLEADAVRRHKGVRGVMKLQNSPTAGTQSSFKGLRAATHDGRRSFSGRRLIRVIVEDGSTASVDLLDDYWR